VILAMKAATREERIQAVLRATRRDDNEARQELRALEVTDKRFAQAKQFTTTVYRVCFGVLAVGMVLSLMWPRIELFFALSPVPPCSHCRGYHTVERVDNKISLKSFVSRYVHGHIPVVVCDAVQADEELGAGFLRGLRNTYPQAPPDTFVEFGSRSWLDHNDSSCEAAMLQWLSLPNASNKYLRLQGNGYSVNTATMASLAVTATLGPTGPRTLPKEEPWYFGWRNQPNNSMHDTVARWLQGTPLVQGAGMKEAEQWLFVANAPQGGQPVCGAGRHVDRVQSASSIHWQLSGRKRWRLWPSPHCPVCPELEVEVQAGEMFVLSNDMWDHATLIPAARSDGELSVSVELQHSW